MTLEEMESAAAKLEQQYKPKPIYPETTGYPKKEMTMEEMEHVARSLEEKAGGKAGNYDRSQQPYSTPTPNNNLLLREMERTAEALERRTNVSGLRSQWDMHTYPAPTGLPGQRTVVAYPPDDEFQGMQVEPIIIYRNKKTRQIMGFLPLPIAQIIVR